MQKKHCYTVIVTVITKA